MKKCFLRILSITKLNKKIMKADLTKNNYMLMIKIANLYFKKGLKQESIARKLNISKYKVCRLLKEAKVVGIVKIAVKS